MTSKRKSVGVSRRRFGALMAASGAAVPALVGQQNQAPPAPGNFQRSLVPESQPFAGKLEFRRKPVASLAEPFPMPQVRLLPGSVYHDAQEWNRGYMARLEADR